DGIRDGHVTGVQTCALPIYTAAFGTAFLAAQGLVRGDEPPAAAARKVPAPRKSYAMKKSINLWAFPYPQKMSLAECFQLAKDAEIGRASCREREEVWWVGVS